MIVTDNVNAAPITMSVEHAAKGGIKGGVLNDGLLNMVEMAFRASDPCLSCATHALGKMPMQVELIDANGEKIDQLNKRSDGVIVR